MAGTSVPQPEPQTSAAAPRVASQGEPHRSQGMDGVVARGARALYEGAPRRGLLAKLGKLVLLASGVQIMPILPIDRTIPHVEASYHDCTAWYYCNSWAPRLCACCVGGYQCMCPAGTFPGSYWWGCCPTPDGSARYWVAMYDCCTNNPNAVSCPNPYCSCMNRTNWNWCSGYGTYYCTTACIQWNQPC